MTTLGCCPRCLGDLIEQDRPSDRRFACAHCGHRGEAVPAAEFLAEKLLSAVVERKISPRLRPAPSTV